MSYTVIKKIKGHLYRYRVHSERHGKRVRQVFEEYLGRVKDEEPEEQEVEKESEV